MGQRRKNRRMNRTCTKQVYSKTPTHATKSYIMYLTQSLNDVFCLDVINIIVKYSEVEKYQFIDEFFISGEMNVVFNNCEFRISWPNNTRSIKRRKFNIAACLLHLRRRPIKVMESEFTTWIIPFDYFYDKFVLK